MKLFSNCSPAPSLVRCVVQSAFIYVDDYSFCSKLLCEDHSSHLALLLGNYSVTADLVLQNTFVREFQLITEDASDCNDAQMFLKYLFDSCLDLLCIDWASSLSICLVNPFQHFWSHLVSELVLTCSMTWFGFDMIRCAAARHSLDNLRCLGLGALDQTCDGSMAES